MKIQVLVGIAAVVAGLFYFKVVNLDDVTKVQCRSKQGEAKSMLKEAQKRLGDDALKSGKVAKSWLDLAWEPKSKRYDFIILDAGLTTFTVEAQPKGDEMNGDVWQINEAATLTNKIDGCARR